MLCFLRLCGKNVVGLDGQIQEFICFIKEKVTDWDFLSGGGNTQRQDSVTTSTRSSFYEFNTDKGTYQCDIGEVQKNTEQPDSVWFSVITNYLEVRRLFMEEQTLIYEGYAETVLAVIENLENECLLYKISPPFPYRLDQHDV